MILCTEEGDQGSAVEWVVENWGAELQVQT